MKFITQLACLAFLAVSSFGQNARYDGSFGQIATLSQSAFQVTPTVPPNAMVLTVCNAPTPISSPPITFPASGVKCTNGAASTFNSAGVACPAGKQDTPHPQPSACQAGPDAQGNVGFWAAPGTYAYAVCFQTSCFGPYVITIGGGGVPSPLLVNFASTNNGLPAFDGAIEAFPNSTYTAGVNSQKRTIGFLSAPTDNSNVNTLTTIDYEAFAPVITGTNTAAIVGYDLYWTACCAAFPATVSAISGMEMLFPGHTLYDGPTFGITIGGMTGIGGNTGIQFASGQLSAAADFAINEQSAYMKNSFGRSQFADVMTCTMSAGTCSAQTIPSTVAPGQAFNVAPKCIGLTWTGTGTLTGILKCVCTTTTCTPSSSVNTDTAQVNFIAIGN